MLGYVPFYFQASPALAQALGSELGRAARVAVQAMLKAHRNLEVAHQQFAFAGIVIAFSSRIGDQGTLFVDLDLGLPGLTERVVLEAELQAAGRKQRDAITQERRRKGIRN